MTRATLNDNAVPAVLRSERNNNLIRCDYSTYFAVRGLVVEEGC